MNARIRITVFLLLLVAGVRPAAAQSDGAIEKAFFRGNDLFEKKDYAGAAAAFAEAIQAGARGAVIHFNLGNAQLARGLFGEAIHQYRLAERAAPRDEDIQANLRLARSKVEEKFARPKSPAFVEALLFCHRSLTIVEEFKLFLLVWGGAMALFLVRVFVDRAILSRIGIVVGIVGLSIGVSLLMRSQGMDRTPEAVILAKEVQVRTGPADSYSVYFLLHQGAEVTVLEESGEWLKIAVEGDRKGFVPKAQAGLL